MARRDDLAAVDRDFVHMFSSWFNRGFLVLRRIDWSTPASILERIIRYEAVHRINGWDDLRRRIDPPDRRCYAFFHPALVDDPLIFVEVALTREIPGAIDPILTVNGEPPEPQQPTTAVFYSISNCQRGLSGVSFGNFLIKQVAEEIAREYPKLTRFVTLSPVPGFAGWLAPRARGRSVEGDQAGGPRRAHRGSRPRAGGAPSRSRSRIRCCARRPGISSTPRRATAGRSIRSRASISATARGSSASTGWPTCPRTGSDSRTA